MKAPTVSLLLLLATLLVPVLRPPPTAVAEDYDETEFRLKTAGVDEAFREEIHGAIRRGVTFLRKNQGRDGSFAFNAGWTSLAGLALRHAAIPKGVEGGRRAIRWLETRGRADAIDQTYQAGLTAMLLKADGRSGDFQHDLHAALARGAIRNPSGYWGYKSAGPGPVPNLSTSQFGCLGLWAGERAGEPVSAASWQHHLEALLEAQEDSGSWPYYPAGSQHRAVVGGYPTGTFMGLADLLLAEEALADELLRRPELLVRTRLARARGQAALRRHALWTLMSSERRNGVGYYAYYRLYALEKACIFLGEEEVGGLPWYRMGARWLVDGQGKDGGWVSLEAPPAPQGNNVVVLRQPLESSFALLFLLRASESYRPITPRPVGGGAVVTPGDDVAPGRAGSEPTVLPLAVAGRVLEDLTASTASPAPDAFARILKAFALLRTTLPRYESDGAALSTKHDEFLRRAEDVLFDAATRLMAPASAPSPAHGATALEALDVLAHGGSRVGPRLLALVRELQLGEAVPRGLRVAWYGAAFDALRRLEPPGLLAFLTGSALSPRPDDWPRTAAALTALGGLPMSGAERYATAKTVLDRMKPLASRHADAPSGFDLRTDVAVLVRRLARPEHKHDFPPLKGQDPQKEFRAVRAWFRTYDRSSARIWRD